MTLRPEQETKKLIRDLGIAAGAIMTSSGIVSYLPDLHAGYLIIGGIVLTKVAMSVRY